MQHQIISQHSNSFNPAKFVREEFTPEKIALIKRTIADGASDDELALFINQCKRTGLDPFSRQIYSIQRQVFDAKQNKRISKMVTQVSIDGLRLIAERSNLYAGQVGPSWSDESGVWKDVWTSPAYPTAARVGVLRKDFAEPLFAVALWSEYCPTYDGKPAAMWAKFPSLMLAKCAEALALRRAFPQELSGLYTSEEMSNADGRVSPKTPIDPQLSRGTQSEIEAEIVQVDPRQAAVPVNQAIVQQEEERPYAPLKLQARIAQVATMALPASPTITDLVATVLQERIQDLDERETVCHFLVGVRDVRRASPKAVTALHRWLKPDEAYNPSSIALQELDILRSYLAEEL